MDGNIVLLLFQELFIFAVLSINWYIMILIIYQEAFPTFSLAFQNHCAICGWSFAVLLRLCLFRVNQAEKVLLEQWGLQVTAEKEDEMENLGYLANPGRL